MWRGSMSIEIKTPEQFTVMREAGLVVARTLRILAAAVRPGVTTAELDALAEAEIRAAGAIPSFKGYHGYPATICTSVNEEIVHGIPSQQRILREGDIISIDCGAIVRGWHAAAAGHSAGHRADGDARPPGDRPARRRVDGHHRRRKLGRALRAHGRGHRGRAVGTDSASRGDSV